MRAFWIKKLLLGVAVVLIMGAAVMLLWNWLVPVLFRGPSISLWQALGLLALCRILTGGWGKGPGGGTYWTQQKQHWRKKFEEKWNNMTPEEQERLKHSFVQCRNQRSEKEQEVAPRAEKV